MPWNGGGDGLPEPADLHDRASRERELDWGAPLPTRADIAEMYGSEAASYSLSWLAGAGAVEPAVTADMVEAIGTEGFPYHLKNRLKSPQSLARKLSTRADYRRGRGRSRPEDVLRYTVGTDHPRDLVTTAVRTVERLLAKGWTIDSAHHSYVDRSRYKGLHVFLHTRGQTVELQVHSRESLAVKELTTPLYEVQRDRNQSPTVRAAAGAEATELSARLTDPAGLGDLETLGGVPITTRRYGDGKMTTSRGSRPVVVAEQPTVRENQYREQLNQLDRPDGTSR
ncbi:RelA/SpoT domain-containing protein [Kribbella sp. DT2]|uniref:RelA/SpoT domain-containing protein n=1 Tax=Kribbella sp. DT2 TaxID=3393427 RepID=UPI003CEA7862